MIRWPVLLLLMWSFRIRGSCVVLCKLFISAPRPRPTERGFGWLVGFVVGSGNLDMAHTTAVVRFYDSTRVPLRTPRSISIKTSSFPQSSLTQPIPHHRYRPIIAFLQLVPTPSS